MKKYILLIAVLFSAIQFFAQADAGCTNPVAQNYDPTAINDDGSCFWGDGLCTGLSYEVVSSDPLGTGAATYRLFANLTADAAEVTAMYGTDTEPWEMIATDANGFYNDAVGSNFGGGVNPLFFSAFPNLEFDSWFTIGAVPGDADGLNSAFDAALNSMSDFNSGGDFVVNTFIGGSVFVVPGANTQGVPVAGKILLGQFTTAGQIHALVNIQVRDQADLSHYAEGMTLTFPQVEVGCMDETACNYNPDAELDNGSCAFDLDDCGVCAGDNSSCTGCTDSGSCNYDSSATIADGSCMMDDVCGICGGDGTSCEGCTDSAACNYDFSAVTNDGSCVYDDFCGICDGDNSSCGGCTDEAACNYDPSVTIDDGSCGLTDVCGECGGDGSACSGCLNPGADNYDSSAEFDDGSCTWGDGLCTGLSYEVVSSDPLGTGATTYRLFANLTADATEVTAMYGTDTKPWEMIATDDAGFYNDIVGADFGGSVNPLFFSSFPNLEFDSWFTIGAAPGDVDGLNSAFDVALNSLSDFNEGGDFVVNTFIGGSIFVVPGANTQGIPVAGRVLIGQFTTVGQIQALVNIQVRDEAQDSHYAEGMTLSFPEGIAGCQDVSACNYNSEAIYADGSCAEVDECGVCDGEGIADGDCDCDGNVLDECGTCGGLGIPDGDCDCNGNVLDECGVCNGDGIPEGDCDCNGNILDECGVCAGSGYTDECGLCNDNPSDDCIQDCAGVWGGVSYTDECGLCNGDPSDDCVQDVCGVWGGDNSSCSGCTNPNADNYDSESLVDDGSCIIFGCTNPDADNYDAAATDDDSSCTAIGCTYVGADNYQEVNTTDDGSCVLSGCTDPLAENFVAFANNNDGSCVMDPCTGGDCPFDANEDGEIGSADLLGFLIAFGATCEELQ